MAKELQRTCKRDGTVWYVPLAAGKMRPSTKIERFGAKSRAVGDRLSASNKRNAGEIQLMALESRDQMIRSASSCPTCGSSSFTEKKVKI